MDSNHLNELKQEAAERGKDPKTRTVVTMVTIVALLVMGGLLGYWINATFKAEEKAETLAQQIALACKSGDFGEGLSPEDISALCNNAEKVIENQGEIQDDEIQEEEIQDEEIQDEEIQDEEFQQPESQNREFQDAELQGPEIQDEEIQDAEIQDDEVQNDEVDDPDPNDPPARVGTYGCPDGESVQSFTFHPDGSVSVVCQSNMPGPRGQ